MFLLRRGLCHWWISRFIVDVAEMIEEGAKVGKIFGTVDG
jgi:hypothetical protein